MAVEQLKVITNVETINVVTVGTNTIVVPASLGTRGATGAQGPQGDQGIQGVQGIPGVGSSILAVRTVLGTDTATIDDDVLHLWGASFTQTLPDPATVTGKLFTLVHTGISLSQVYNISASGLGTYALYTNGETLGVYSNGTGYYQKNHLAQTDWIAFPSVAAGTLITGVTNPPAYGDSGSPVTNAAYWRRDGRDALIRWDYRHTSLTGAGPGSGAYLFNLPSGLGMDAALVKVNTNNTGGGDFSDSSSLGTFKVNYSTDANGIGDVAAQSLTQLKSQASVVNGTATSIGVWGSAFIAFNANAALSYHLEARVPIDGWRP